MITCREAEHCCEAGDRCRSGRVGCKISRTASLVYLIPDSPAYETQLFLEIRYDHEEGGVVFCERPRHFYRFVAEHAECLEHHPVGVRYPTQLLLSDISRPDFVRGENWKNVILQVSGGCIFR